MSSSQSQQPSVADLFQSAQEQGLSRVAISTLNIPDMGALISAGLGIVPDDVPAQEVTLVAVLIDDSGSIRFQKNAQHVRDGFNLILDSLGGSKQSNGVLLYCLYLNGKLLTAYALLDQVPRMDTHNYDPNGGTPLYDQTALILASQLAKLQEFEDAGTPVRTVTVIVTDGQDEGSRKHTPSTIRTVVREMLSKERHIIAAIGIECPGVDFKQVFGEMGLEDRWILTPGNNPSDIRRAFEMASQSAVRASQGGANFSKTAVGGFGANP
jgi:hypothetical protein